MIALAAWDYVELGHYPRSDCANANPAVDDVMVSVRGIQSDKIPGNASIERQHALNPLATRSVR